MPPCCKIVKGDESSELIKTALISLLVLALPLTGCNNSRKPVWQWTLESRSYAEPVVDGNKVYVVSQAGEIISGDCQTGKQIWRKKVRAPILAAPAFSEKLLFVGTEEGDIYAMDKTNGREVWKKHFADHFVAPLTVAPKMVLAPSRDGTLYALSLDSGDLLWQHQGNRKYNTRAVVSGTNILVGGWARDFYCLRMDGSVNWRFKTGYVIVEDPVVHNGVVYFTSHDHYVYAITIASGKLLWRFLARPHPTNPLLIKNELVFGDEKQFLFFLHPESGKLLRKMNINKRMSRLFEWSGKCLIVSQKVYEVDPELGKLSVFLALPQPVFKLAFAPRILIATDELYSVFAFRN